MVLYVTESEEQLACSLPIHRYDNPAYDDHAQCLAQARAILLALRERGYVLVRLDTVPAAIDAKMKETLT